MACGSPGLRWDDWTILLLVLLITEGLRHHHTRYQVPVFYSKRRSRDAIVLLAPINKFEFRQLIDSGRIGREDCIFIFIPGTQLRYS